MVPEGRVKVSNGRKQPIVLPSKDIYELHNHDYLRIHMELGSNQQFTSCTQDLIKKREVMPCTENVINYLELVKF